MTSVFLTYKKWCRTSNMYLEFLNSQVTSKFENFIMHESATMIFYVRCGLWFLVFVGGTVFTCSWWSTCPQIVLQSNCVSQAGNSTVTLKASPPRTVLSTGFWISKFCFQDAAGDVIMSTVRARHGARQLPCPHDHKPVGAGEEVPSAEGHRALPRQGNALVSHKTLHSNASF